MMARLSRKVVLLTFCAAALAHSQGLGTITGTVTDPSGAAVAGAGVVVTEESTQLRREARSSTEGYFAVPSLRPGSYSVKVEAPGFRLLRLSGLQLQADQTLPLRLRVEIGIASETVRVEATAVQVDTDTATMRQVVDQDRMLELPLNGRNAAELMTLVAGVTAAPSGGVDQGSAKTMPGAVVVSMNGSRQGQVSFQMDGGNNTDEYSNANQPFPFPDALQEFSVQTSNYSAEHGLNAGGVVNVITKSGTNRYQGGAFGFARNSVFNARNYFAPARDPLKRSQYGGTAGGPLTIPRVYQGKDRTFFFAGYQGTKLRNSSQNPNAFVPTQANLAGDFRALLDRNHPDNPLGRSVQLVDPIGRTPFAGNQIPVSRFDRAALSLAKGLPPATGKGLIFYALPQRQDFNEFLVRGDHALSGNHRLTGRYYYDRFVNAGNFNPNNLIAYRNQSVIVSQNMLVQHTHIFRPDLLNDLRFTFGRVHSVRGPVEGVPNLNDFGVKIYQPPAKGLESIAVQGYFTIGDNPRALFARSFASFKEDLRWVAGRHNFSFGGLVQHSRQGVENDTMRLGQFTFSGDASGAGLSDFLLGSIRQFKQGNGQQTNHRAMFYALYAQDNIRATRRLSLSLGLRYEPVTLWREVDGIIEQFRPDAYARNVRSKVFQNAPPGLFFPGDEGFPRNGASPDLNNLAPRVGFAWDVLGTGKLSVRGGGGLFYDSRQVGVMFTGFTITPFSTQVQLTPPPGPFSDPYGGQASPFPTPKRPLADAAFPPPTLAKTFDPYSKYTAPLLYNWNLLIERLISSSWLLRVGYIGSHGSHIGMTIDLNPAVYLAGSRLSVDQRRPFQGFTNIYMNSMAVNSSYNSLQISVEKRMTSRFTLLANYTFSKSINDLPINQGVSGFFRSTTKPWWTEGFRRFDRGLADFDRSHHFVASYVWKLPGPSGLGAVLRFLAGGWETSGIMRAATGMPITVLAGQDRSGTGTGLDRVNLVGPPYGPGACGNTAPCIDYLVRSSFALPDLGSFGSMGKSSLRAMGLFNWDVGFMKSIRWGERLRVQLRAEFFNLLNHTNPSSPTSSLNSAGFGTIRGAADPRIGQLALKLAF